MPENTENKTEEQVQEKNQAAEAAETVTQQETQGGTADFPEFEESRKKGFMGDDKLEFLKDLQLNVYIELGRTRMQIKDILELERGYVIELEKLASEPVDVFVNNKKIAEGEVVVIDKHFGIRITNLVSSEERMKSIK